MNNPYQWPDGTPRSQGNAFDWHAKTSAFASQLQKDKTTANISSALVQSKKITTITYSKAGNK